MAKDAKGHGSEARGGSQNGGAAHQMGVDAASKGLFSDAQIATLKSGYAGIDKVDPSQPFYSDMVNFPLLFKLTALLDKASPAQLKQLAGAGIKFVSPLAQNRVSRSGGKSDYTADRIYGDRRDLRD